jgi:hypothetical protein
VRRFSDDLPAVKISRLRALDLITAETTEFVVRLGGVERPVAVKLRKFPNQGSWSLFVCPACGRCAQVLRLLDDAVVCRRCCVRRGVRWRCEPMGLRQRAEHRIPRLKALLQSERSLRLKPHLWGTMERRVRLEAALRKAQLLVGYADFVKPKPGEDPCE